MKFPSRIKVVEVGARDGLQNEPRIRLLPREQFLQARLQFVCALAEAGIKDVEAGAFVREDLVPQMSGTGELLKRLREQRPDLWKKTRFWTLVPNERGLEDALKAGAKYISVFTATSESFNQRNIRMSIQESMRQISSLMGQAQREKLKVRAYISTVWGCPYEGKTSPKKALKMTEQLLEMGAEEVSLGDTIGVATPKAVAELLKPVAKKWPLAGHFHDTRGTALANALAAMDQGVESLDSSAGGLGGCPYAPGAAGNLATEDLLYMLQGMNIRTGINLQQTCQASENLARTLGFSLPSRFHRAWAAGKTNIS